MSSSSSSAPRHAGFIALLGAPNAGKSTLLNRLIGQKISIVSPKAQTTRIRTLGILTEGDTQIGFIDTPGIFTPKRRLDRAMVQTAWHSLKDADALVFLVDAASHKNNDPVFAIVEDLKKALPSGKEKTAAPRVILALNKVDVMDRDRLLPQAAFFDAMNVFSDIFMISAQTGDGIEDLKKYLKALMPESPWFFDEDQISDLPSQILAAETTREQVCLQLQQELPYAAAVLPGSFEEKRDGSLVVRQTIVVAREGHRPIVLGKGGARIKNIGEKARHDLARLFDRPVHLFLDVSVDEKWYERPTFYRTFGLDLTDGVK
ncbi:MAG: GTPase Era [Alphaproteobacteria bacterium]|nr:GTPase Era [Alphaproteobacteria bacterium]